ncbi:Hint domain-containing protein [Spartinivicinus poritis]|uniref:Hint domain-containing protein n=1 Tax=Spartinivicinus poritis TaxID=2994640 RepID=A0ABT5U980_9GAMM|nr:Hint domain-containing protein [Spartinivicinus sp. A2-2]MDE1462013.1 Hint domain-containing protein [Spartinivicinus sp. A2-2]
MKVSLLKIFLPVALIGISSSVFATDPIRFEKRCEDDSLNSSAAFGRNDWAKKCKYISHRTWDFNINDDFGKRRGRPFYPSFYQPNNFDNWFKAPTAGSAKCGRGAGDKYTKILTCLASCYTPDQKLLFSEGELTIYDAFSRQVKKIVTLDDSASLNNLQYTVRPVDAYSESVRDVLHEILVIKTQSGGQLKVTPNHPLLVSSGHMRNAEDLKIGDSLISQNGSYDPVVSIKNTNFFGKVYNVRPDSSSEDGVSLNGQIVIAQGFLSGSMYYQNTGVYHVNRLVLRDNLPEELL